jgi:hypothetical protein
MRIILDVSADADNHIEGTASWANSGKPIQFSGWLALMLLLEQANPGSAGAQPAARSDHPEDPTARTPAATTPAARMGTDP